MNKPVLTVSVAAYNVENYLAECLEPFADYEFNDNLEVIIVNDGSTDSTLKIAEEYKQNYPKIFKIVDKVNGGWGSTINAALEVAKGEYFKQLDGDDYFHRDNLKKLIAYLKDKDVDIVLTPFITFENETDRIISVNGSFEQLDINCIYKICGTENIFENVAMHSLTVKTNVLYSDTFKLRITENCFYTDVEYLVKSINNSDNYEYLGLPIYYYRVGREGQSVSKTGIVKHYKEHKRVLFNCLDYVNNEVYDLSKKTIITKRLEDMLFAQYQRFCYLDISLDVKNELKEFDTKIRTEYNFIDIKNSKAVIMLRKSHYLLYPLVALIIRRRYPID